MMKLWITTCASVLLSTSTAIGADVGFYVYSNRTDLGYSLPSWRRQQDFDIEWLSGTRVAASDVLTKKRRAVGDFAEETPGGRVWVYNVDFCKEIRDLGQHPIEDGGPVFAVTEEGWFKGVVCRTRQTVKDEFDEYTSTDMYIVLDQKKVRFIVLYPYEFQVELEPTFREVSDVGGDLLSTLTKSPNRRWRDAPVKPPVMAMVVAVPDPEVKWLLKHGRRLALYSECDMPRKRPAEDGGDATKTAEAFKGWIRELRTLQRTYENTRKQAGYVSVMTTHIARDGIDLYSAANGLGARHNKRIKDAK